MLVTGRSQMGKTTFVVKLIISVVRHEVDRIIVICPSFWVQKTFAPMHHLVKEQDVYPRLNKQTFKIIEQTLDARNTKAVLSGGRVERVLILVDDMAGNPILYGSRQGPFGHLAVRTPHLQLSMIVITQQPMFITPAFRENCEYIVVFPSEGIVELDWLKRNYESIIMKRNKVSIEDIVCFAWQGGRRDSKEWGTHFLIIESIPRQRSRYWIDFNKIISVNPKGQLTVANNKQSTDELWVPLQAPTNRGRKPGPKGTRPTFA